MKITDFVIECTNRSISPDIALENLNIQHYLKMGMDEEVIQVLNTEF
jgi:hypothetical protein